MLHGHSIKQPSVGCRLNQFGLWAYHRIARLRLNLREIETPMTERNLPAPFQDLEPYLEWRLRRQACDDRTYSPPAKNLAGRFSQECGKCFFRDTLLEDGSTLERTQAMLMSGVKKEFYLQDQELILRHRLQVAETYINA